MWFFDAILHLLQLRYLKLSPVRRVSSPCNSSGSKGELCISSQFGFNFDFVAQQQATATRKSDLRAPRGIFPKRVALPQRRAWIAATTPKSWRKQTTALLSANPPKRFPKL